MWRLTWSLLTTGIPFEFASQSTKADLMKQIEGRTLWRTLRERRPNPDRVIFRSKNEHLVAYLVKKNAWVLARPVYYAELREDESTTIVSGRFRFQKVVRVRFWLASVLILIFEGLMTVRFTTALVEGTLSAQWFGYTAMLFSGFIVGFIVGWLLLLFTRHNAGDMSQIVDELRVIGAQ